MQLKFVDEVPPSPSGKYNELFAALQARPNEWAEIATYPNVGRNKSNPGPASALRKRGCQVAQRVTEDGSHIILYAMWPGE